MLISKAACIPQVTLLISFNSVIANERPLESVNISSSVMVPPINALAQEPFPIGLKLPAPDIDTTGSSDGSG